MARLKFPLTFALALFLLIDIVVALRLASSGWPKEIALSSPQPGVEQVRVIAIPFTGTDWWILALAGIVHAALAILIWKAWRTAVRS